MKPHHIVFVINLLQDINILRPLVYMAARDLGLQTLFLVTAAFRKRDKSGIWQQELAEIALDTRTHVVDFDHEFEAVQALRDKSGLLVAGSESHLSAHKPVHDLFRITPSQFLKVTLQHGFECVGFLQSRDQNLAHGTQITFAADIICGWCDAERLTAVAPSQRHKLYVAGPTAVLQIPERGKSKDQIQMGLVCENMHSPRLNVAGDFKTDFLGVFGAYCAELDAKGRKVALRPHPGGQYTLKNNVPLPGNVVINNAPIYKADLSRYAYGISAPSSILIDMAWAGIPVAVWQDQGSIIDLGNYDGLTRISSLKDWLDFTEAAVADPERFTRQQNEFLEKQLLHSVRDDVYQRYSSLLLQPVGTQAVNPARFEPMERIQLVANGYTPTLQLSFLKPLSHLVASGNLAIDVISENHMNREFKVSGPRSQIWLSDRFAAFRPTLVIFSRYSGPHAEWMLQYLGEKGIPTVYHIDDDLLSIPREIGIEKYLFHNQQERLASLRYLLDNVTLIYCSTQRLKTRLEELRIEAPVVAGDIYCSGELLSPPRDQPEKIIGYMGIGHESDLASVLPALVKYLRRNENVAFELFGSIPIPNELGEFGDRVTQLPKFDDYEEFLLRFAERKWAIGICPLTPADFNMVKANTKWVEYTSVGAAVVASRNTIYDECCAGGCGILADTEEEWVAALEKLTNNPEERLQMVSRAQDRLRKDYSIEDLRSQIIDIFEQAKQLAAPAPQERSNLECLAVTGRQERVIYIANSLLATLQLSFIKPLDPLVSSKAVAVEYITEEQIKQQLWKNLGYASEREWVIERFSAFRPTLVVFCRYSGSQAQLILDLANEFNIPSIYHIDDDLLNIPPAIGEGKFKYHNNPKRTQSVSLLLAGVTLVYCSTQKLKSALERLPVNTPLVAGQIYCSGHALREPEVRPVRKVGYMASADHAHNLSIITGAIVRFLRENPIVNFEFFGSIPSPPEFQEFGARISFAPKVSNYEEFLQRFAERGWDIGICPLTPIHFNMMKANTKWVEYTTAGTAVVASKGTVYDECCADGCGILADTEDEWFAALDNLARDPVARFNQVRRAQEKLARSYSTESLRAQVLDVFSQAHDLHLKSKLKESIQ